MSGDRQIIPIHEGFFNDGYWYVLGSTSLGGSGLTAKEIGDRLQSHEPDVLQNLLEKGICLPLYFPADCCLDDALIVVGDLTEKEEQEWIGRLQGKLHIPCGEFMVMGGGLPEDFEEALTQFSPSDPYNQAFQKVKVTPGTYLVEIYAFASSINADELWEDAEIDEDDILTWWDETHPNQPIPLWLKFYVGQEDEGDFDLEEDLVDYIIRLERLDDESIEVPMPKLDEDVLWCGVYDMRQHKICPEGLSRATLLQQ
ncbi:hypothetical protein Lepto7376_2794 [[Leptolyngbya] sp. PCC 7376]|uniref:hypothetical protein n=1 Tax=[Leptolyngbya] sp. PCC 7376 TaxID=111781 RepID=UPI00029F0E37|nr:hypothetical protein [[Leptolyngbya] sp. PCC 7376]AFY39051.1 hypothetical protein Lepto7376_2794 [[Leptolyngbya] sp. PCC 7376]